MNFAAVVKAFDTFMALRDTAKRITGSAPPHETGLSQTVAASGLAGQIEARLTNVVVAALKEAFDRDHTRLELERAQMEEQRRRAEEAMRLELRRQAADREVGRLRLLAGAALIGWIAAVALLVARLDVATVWSRIIMSVGWLLLLASLGTAFNAQGRLGRLVAQIDQPLDAGGSGTATLWLLVAGLAMSAASLLL